MDVRSWSDDKLRCEGNRTKAQEKLIKEWDEINLFSVDGAIPASLQHHLRHNLPANNHCYLHVHVHVCGSDYSVRSTAVGENISKHRFTHSELAMLYILCTV